MLLFKLKDYSRNFFRGIYILRTVFIYYAINRMAKSKFGHYFVPAAYKRNSIILSSQERLRIMIEKLGPTFVKFGQILADRSDLVSEAMRDELRKLHSNVSPISNEIAFEIIETELGGPITNYFSYVDPVCIGSASIGQVYKAILKTGELVVIKIQRPDISEKIKVDIRLLHYIAFKLGNELQTLKSVDLPQMVNEFGEALTQELNYFNEAANTVRFAELFKNSDLCYIPKVFSQYTTEKLIVLEFIDGVIVKNREQLISNNLNPEIVAEKGLKTFTKMILEHGFFHRPTRW